MAALAGESGSPAAPDPSLGTNVTDQPQTARPLRLLVAEDNNINQILMQTALTRLGHTVSVAENGIEAVEAVGREAFDVILMDIEMPEMDGEEAARRIRARHGAKPVMVALTAHAGDTHRDRFLTIGFDGYLAKPVDFDALEVLLGELMDAGDDADAGRNAGEASGSLIDMARIEALTQALDPIMVATMLVKFADGLDGVGVKLQEMQESGDLPGMGKQVHALKGMSLNFGARFLGDAAQSAERKLKDGAALDEDELNDLLDHIVHTHHEVLNLSAQLRENSPNVC